MATGLGVCITAGSQNVSSQVCSWLYIILPLLRYFAVAAKRPFTGQYALRPSQQSFVTFETCFYRDTTPLCPGASGRSKAKLPRPTNQGTQPKLARRQDLAAGGKKPEGGHIFKILY